MSKSSGFMRRALRLLAILVVVLAIALLGGALWLRGQIDASQAQLEGVVRVEGLTHAVRIDRDDAGVPTLVGRDRGDLAFALGFVHGQERFFQMDLARRRAAGELSALLGPATLAADREARRHRFRALAEQAIAVATEEKGAYLRRYAKGVNAGLEALEAAPPEYLVLRRDPEPWRPEDCTLVQMSMYMVLQSQSGTMERQRGAIHREYPPEMAALLDAPGTAWDAPVEGEARETPPLPGPEVFDIRAWLAANPEEEEGKDELAQLTPAYFPEPELQPGSNNFAVAASRSGDGQAWLANDMHLSLAVPNTWFRASLVLEDEILGTRSISGVTLPGAPAVVVGSTKQVAWGFTNSNGDWSDVVLLEKDPDSDERYMTPEGPRAFDVFEETIEVKGQEDEVVSYRWTVWGPVIPGSIEGHELAYRWVAHDLEGHNMRLMDLENAGNLDEALAIGSSLGIPAQNFVAVDREGRIGWTIGGPIPRRFGDCGRLPASWADGSSGWEGYLAPEENPRIVDPESGFIWTANARVVDGDALALIGDAGYDLGARAKQIRDALFDLDERTPEALFDIMLDDRALFLERWRELMLQTLDAQPVEPGSPREELRAFVEDWGARAAVDSVGYRAVRGFRAITQDAALDPLFTPCKRAFPACRVWRSFQAEGLLWRLVNEKPAHLLGPEHESWDALLEASIQELLRQWTIYGSIAERTWGQRNVVRPRHPLSRALPVLAGYLDMPSRPLAGDDDMPRVQGRAFGASERLAVSPGRQEASYLHMPGGQSGHFRSPHYRSQHAAWAEGRRTPFLPGPTTHVLTLEPTP